MEDGNNTGMGGSLRRHAFDREGPTSATVAEQIALTFDDNSRSLDLSLSEPIPIP